MIWIAISLGFLGSVHCAAMCGPLMIGLSARSYNWFAIVLHHMGRIGGYVFLAILLSAFTLPAQLLNLQQWIGFLSGILILFYGLKYYVKPIEKVFALMSGKISALMGKTQSPLLLGVLNGLLPCGLSFGAASLAISYAAMADKLGFMLLFGVGTLPVLLLVYYLPRDPLLNKWRLNSSYLPRLLVVMGLLVIIRSSGLGIPYLSPAFNVEENKLECCE